MSPTILSYAFSFYFLLGSFIAIWVFTPEVAPIKVSFGLPIV